MRLAAAVIATATIGSCGGKSDEGSSAPVGTTTSTTAAPATTTTLEYATDRTGATPPDAAVVSMRDYKFSPSSLRTESAKLQLALKNDETPCAGSNCDAELVHDVVILDSTTGLPLARSEKLSPSESGVFTVDGLSPGSYRFFCSVHVMASMEGTLDVAG